jgi:hypothetical protein
MTVKLDTSNINLEMYNNINFNKSNQINYDTSMLSKNNKMQQTIVDKIFEDNFKNYKAQDMFSFDDSKLKRFNTILTNLHFDVLKQSYEMNRHNFMENKKLKEKRPKKIEKLIRNYCHHHHDNQKNKSTTSKTDYSHSSSTHLRLRRRTNSISRRKSITNRLDSSASSGNSSTLITIHVCDDSKNVKKDFECPRDLLVTEMKYFSLNLNSQPQKKVNTDIALLQSTAKNQRENSIFKADSNDSTSVLFKRALEEIDISVHCDIEIFEWLMKYVKRKDLNTEPKLEITNCVSIMLSADFLLMNDLLDKCILFISKHLNTILQSPNLIGGINDSIQVKLAACIPIKTLESLHDRKDKIKTKLFQRKIEFLFNKDKYEELFDNSSVLYQWRDNIKFIEEKEEEKEDENHCQNYQYFYESQNDATTLFRCKMCSKLMTKQQSSHLKCDLVILDSRGEHVYLHVADNQFDATLLLQILKEKLKYWQNVYWFLWALTKSAVCKTCGEVFRFVDISKCRLNGNTQCDIHDKCNLTSSYLLSLTNSPKMTSKMKQSNEVDSNNINNTETEDETKNNKQLKCSCIYSNHSIDIQKFYNLVVNSPGFEQITPVGQTFFETERMNRYATYLVSHLEKHEKIISNGINSNEQPKTSTIDSESDSGENITFCDMIENLIKADSNSNSISTNNNQPVPQQQQQQSVTLPIAPSTLNRKSLSSSSQGNKASRKKSNGVSIKPVSFFIDSITGKHISLVSKNIIKLINLAYYQNQLNVNDAINSINQQTNNNNIAMGHPLMNSIPINSFLDINSYLELIQRVDVHDPFEVLNYLRFDIKTKWDASKTIKLNQDNQREDDLKRFREISNNLIKAKLIDENQKNLNERSIITNAALSTNNKNQNNNSNNSITNGGIYCRVEMDWKQRNN